MKFEMLSFCRFLNQPRFSLLGIPALVLTMSKSPWILVICISCIISFTLASTSYPYSTLDGNPPLTISRGGASSFFPDMTALAFTLAIDQGTNFLLCGILLTKDGKGFCSPSISLSNSTNIDSIATEKEFRTFEIDGQSISGFFSPQFNYSTLKTLKAIQSNPLRPFSFNEGFEILDPYEAASIALDSNVGIYFEIFSPSFFASQGLNISDYVQNLIQYFEFERSSDPIIIAASDLTILKFLKKITNVKLVFKFLDSNQLEESTQTTFDKLTSDDSLSSIKSMADAISIPKSYIYPQQGRYVDRTMDIVARAHKAGLYVYVSNFNNDAEDFSWQWLGDPVVEVLNYLPVKDSSDQELGSVDGIITDFPATAATALECYYPFDSLLERANNTPLIIGESNGELPPQSQESFQTAINEGVDVLFCNVQLSSDGVPICRNQANLDLNTNILAFTSLSSQSYPDVDDKEGRFVFDYNSSFILDLSATQLNAIRNSDLSGIVISLETFFELGLNYTLKNITFLIDLQYANFLKAEKNLDMAAAVQAIMDKYSTDLESRNVYIQSFEKGILQTFRRTYNRTSSFPIIQRIDFCQKWSDDAIAISKTCVDPSSGLTYIDHISDEGLDAIAAYADGISVLKQVIDPISNLDSDRPDSYFMREATDLVERAKKKGLKVFVYNFLNEPTILEWDYFGDPTVQANFWLTNFDLDGLFTSYPLTISNYFASRCYKSVAPDDPPVSLSPSPAPSPSPSSLFSPAPSPSSSSSSDYYVPSVSPGYYLEVVQSLYGLSDVSPPPPPPPSQSFSPIPQPFIVQNVSFPPSPPSPLPPSASVPPPPQRSSSHVSLRFSFNLSLVLLFVSSFIVFSFV